MPHSTGPRRKRCFVLLFECHGGRGGAGRPRSPRRHRPPQCTTSAHALQLHNEYVDLKPYRTTKKEIMIAKLLAKNFERFGHTITPQRKRGALPKVAQGGGLRLVHVSPIFLQTFKNRPCFAYVGPIRRLVHVSPICKLSKILPTRARNNDTWDRRCIVNNMR